MRYLPILFAVLISGCVGPTPPKPAFMNEQLTGQIILQRTTADEIRQLLGRPQQIEQVQEPGAVSTVWTYQFVQKGVNELIPALREKYNRPALRSILRIKFDEKKIVQKMDRMDRDLRGETEGAIKVPF